MNHIFYTSHYCHLLFETKEVAMKMRINSGEPVTETLAKSMSQFISRNHKTKVFYTNPKEIIYVVPGQDKNEKDKVLNVIVGDKIGWIVNSAWTYFTPLKHQK